jgi:hypothetical protein
MVEGVRHPRDDAVGHCIGILQYILRGDPQQCIALLNHVPVSISVTFRPVAEGMNLSINLNDQSCFQVAKISHIRSDWMLPPNLEAQPATSHSLPQHHLGDAHRFAQLARLIDLGPLLGR